VIDLGVLPVTAIGGVLVPVVGAVAAAGRVLHLGDRL
jgi:hypothetical protein